MTSLWPTCDPDDFYASLNGPGNEARHAHDVSQCTIDTITIATDQLEMTIESQNLKFCTHTCSFSKVKTGLANAYD